jgi:hypothetical protein
MVEGTGWVILDISEFISDSLGLGRKLYYRSYPAWVLPLSQPPRGTAGGPPFLKLWGLKQKGTSRWGAHRDGEEMTGLPRGSSRPMDLPPGHRMGVGLPDSYLYAQQNH